MNDLRNKVIEYLKCYNDWTIRIIQIRNAFASYPSNIDKVIHMLIGEGKLIVQENKAFVKVKIGG